VQQRDEHEQASAAVQEQPPVVGQAQDLPDMRQGGYVNPSRTRWGNLSRTHRVGG